MALAVRNANAGAEFVFPTSEEVGHPVNDNPSNQPRGLMATFTPGTHVLNSSV